ncbi:MAG: DUF3108 domain-containing protein [Candidatus Omnitrophica bacterium]|nr:DUF3108 domain-containing protein [Candidatus Omnitrophota bacterium]
MTSVKLFTFSFLIFTFSGCSNLTYFTHREDLGKLRQTKALTQEMQVPEKKFRVGETLDYDVNWMGLNVGSGRLEVREVTTYQDHQVYHLVVSARSNRFLSTFYPVEDEIHSYVDVETLTPYRFEKRQREGRYRAHEEMVYDPTSRKATYRSFLNNSTKEMEIPPSVQDSLSTLFYFRTLPLETGQSVFIDVNADEKNWRLEVKVLKAGLLKLFGKKEVPALLVEPLAQFHGVFIRKGRMWIWFSLDQKRTPLYMKARVPFGIIEVVLKKES